MKNLSGGLFCAVQFWNQTPCHGLSFSPSAPIHECCPFRLVWLRFGRFVYLKTAQTETNPIHQNTPYLGWVCGLFGPLGTSKNRAEVQSNFLRTSSVQFWAVNNQDCSFFFIASRVCHPHKKLAWSNIDNENFKFWIFFSSCLACTNLFRSCTYRYSMKLVFCTDDIFDGLYKMNDSDPYYEPGRDTRRPKTIPNESLKKKP